MPVIAITSDQRMLSPKVESHRIRPSRPEIFLKKALISHVSKVGAMPLIIPPCEVDIMEYCSWICQKVDGIIISGGAFDIDPRHYDSTIEARIDRIDEERTQVELILARKAIEHNIPLLGICGGMQVMAVACGGKLLQDIATTHPQALEHEQPTDPAQCWHDVLLSGQLETIYQSKRISVNSTHHQAVLESSAYQVVGRATDGIIEAIALKDHRFAVGVQWHPELLRDTLFHYFVHSVGDS